MPEPEWTNAIDRMVNAGHNLTKCRALAVLQTILIGVLIAALIVGCMPTAAERVMAAEDHAPARRDFTVTLDLNNDGQISLADSIRFGQLAGWAREHGRYVQEIDFNGDGQNSLSDATRFGVLMKYGHMGVIRPNEPQCEWCRLGVIEAHDHDWLAKHPEYMNDEIARVLDSFPEESR